MDETPFYKTRMGQIFYERTMPELVKQLERLNGILGRAFSEGVEAVGETEVAPGDHRAEMD